MKKLLLILLCLPLLFTTCKKEEVEEVLPCLCGNNGINFSDSLSNTYNIAIFVPNSFTPNGDEHNEIFIASAFDFTEDTLHAPFFIPTLVPISNLTISNGRGDVIFTTNVPGKGWDGGNYQNGEYNYQISCEYNGYTYQKYGKVSLIRDIGSLSNTFDCYPNGITNCIFGDMLDPQRGFVYMTAEDIHNWGN